MPINNIGLGTSADSGTGDNLRLGGQKINANFAYLKTYIDNLIQGLKWKNAVQVATTANITLSGEQTIDGVLTSTSRVLVKDQTDATLNGIYVSASGAWTRATDADVDDELVNATVSVTSGTVNGVTNWTCNADTVTLGTTELTFVPFVGADGVDQGTFDAAVAALNAEIDSRVDSVTGDGVDNTDPNNPVLSFPDADQVDDSTTANKFVTSTEKSKIGNLPNDTNAQLTLKANDSEVVKSVSVNGGTPVTPDGAGNVDLTVSEAGGSSTTDENGTTINFTQDHIYNKSAPISGNITIDPTGAVLGTTVVCYVKASTEPSISGATNKFQSGRFLADKLCEFWFFWRGDGFRLNKVVDNRPQMSSPANFTATSISSTQLNLDWDDVTGATNYLLYRSTTNDFGAATQIYSGATSAYSDTGLTGGTTYYYWVIAQGNDLDSEPSTTSGIPTAATYLFSDAFTGTTIDTAKWTIEDNGDFVVSQNDELVMTDAATASSGTSRSRLTSNTTFDSTTGVKVLRFDMTAQSQNPFFVGFGSADNDWVRVVTRTGGGIIFDIQNNGGSAGGTEHAGISPNNSFKIRLEAGTAHLYYWNVSQWTLVNSIAFPANAGYAPILNRYGASVASEVYTCDNLYVTDFDYTTLNP